jgi:hypothetical protein
MSSSIETGHAKNVANFEKLITNVSGFGRAYNPSKESIKLSALNALLASAKGSINQVNSMEPAYKNAVSAREAAFAPLAKLITRVNNSLKASNSSSQVDDSAMTLVRKLQGRRATPKMTDDEKKAAATEGKEVNQISASQMSYDSRLDNFDKLIKLLTSEPEYSPNEADLKIDSLTTLYNDLSSKNTAVINATVPLNNARISRNNVLYTPLSGIVDISVDVKTYIKSVFGATSPKYKAISGLTFTSAK